MATNNNSLDIIPGFEKSEQLQALYKKSKPKNDNKPDTARIANGVGDYIDVYPRAFAVSEVAESSKSVMPAAHVIKPPAAAQTQNVVIGASEAVAILNCAAREAKSLLDEMKLWQRQVWKIGKSSTRIASSSSTCLDHSYRYMY